MKSIEHEVLMLSKAKNNLNKYLDSLRWLETIYKTCKYWTSESLSSFKNLPPQDIEVIIINYQPKFMKLNFLDYLPILFNVNLLYVGHVFDLS